MLPAGEVPGRSLLGSYSIPRFRHVSRPRRVKVIRIQTLGGLSVRGDDGKPLAGAAGQPRRMSILALLARAGDRGISREKMLSLLWPDADEQGARTLAQALYALRKDLGAEDAITGARSFGSIPRLSAPTSASSRPRVRAETMRAPRPSTGAVPRRLSPLRRGRVLAVGGTGAVGARARPCARTRIAARAALATGQPDDSVDWWRRLAALDPLNARVTVGLMGAFVAAGDRAGAIRHAHVYEVLARAGARPSAGQGSHGPGREVTAGR